MTDDSLGLVEPCRQWREAFVEMAAEFHAAGETGWPHGARVGHRLALDDFDAYLGQTRDVARGENLPDGWVPARTYWLRAGEAIVGTASLRLQLNDFLLNYGGHIGYCIRPSRRRQGLMKRFLPLVLDAAGAHGLRRVLITCDPDNAASAATIVSAGGVFEDERTCPDDGKARRRFWIDLPGD